MRVDPMKRWFERILPLGEGGSGGHGILTEPILPSRESNPVPRVPPRPARGVPPVPAPTVEPPPLPVPGPAPAPPPVPATTPDPPPVLLLLNAGLLHHVGPSRMYVRIARRLAARGIPVLRFDFPGIGDRGPRRDALPFSEAAPLETVRAMDALEERLGRRPILVGGLCSGADMAWRAAIRDERVVGLLQVDPWGWRTPRWYLHHYGPRIVDPAAWQSAVAVRLKRVQARVRAAREGASIEETGAIPWEPPQYRRRVPPRREFDAGMRLLARRPVRFLIFLSGDQPDWVNHAGQYERSLRHLPLNGLLEVEFDRMMDHTLTHPDHQARVLDRIERWVSEGWLGADGPADPTGRPVAGRGGGQGPGVGEGDPAPPEVSARTPNGGGPGSPWGRAHRRNRWPGPEAR